MYYISYTRNDKDQAPVSQPIYITQTFLMKPLLISNKILVNTPPAHLTVKAQAFSKRAGCGARTLENSKKIVFPRSNLPIPLF